MVCNLGYFITLECNFYSAAFKIVLHLTYSSLVAKYAHLFDLALLFMVPSNYALCLSSVWS